MWSTGAALLPQRIDRLLYVEGTDVAGIILELPECEIGSCWAVGSVLPEHDPRIFRHVSWDAFLRGDGVPEEVADCALVNIRETHFSHNLQVLRRVKSALKYGGTLYLSLEAKRWWKSTKDIEETLMEMGFSLVDIKGFGLVPPDRKSPFILPTGSKYLFSEVLRELWLHKGKTFKNKVKLSTLWLANQIGLLRVVWKSNFYVGKKEREGRRTSVKVRCSPKSLINGRTGVTVSEDTLELLSRKLDCDDLTVAVYPGHRKVIMPVYSQVEGTLAYAKLFTNRNTIQAGQNEARLLRKLAEYQFEAAELPDVLVEEGGMGTGQYLLVVSTKRGLKNIFKFSTRHMDWLVELFNKTSVLITFERSTYHLTVEAQLSQVLRHFTERDCVWLEELIHGAVVKLSAEDSIPLGMVQREFPYAHALKHGEKLFVIDWELGNERYPPYFDLYHFMLSLERELHADIIESYLKKVDRLFFSKICMRDIILDYSCKIGVASRLSHSFFILYLLDQCSIHLTWDDVDTMAQQKFSALELMYKGRKYVYESWLGEDVQ